MGSQMQRRKMRRMMLKTMDDKEEEEDQDGDDVKMKMKMRC